MARAIAPNVTAVLKIAREYADAMIAHARDDHPDEEPEKSRGQGGEPERMRRW